MEQIEQEILVQLQEQRWEIAKEPELVLNIIKPLIQYAKKLQQDLTVTQAQIDTLRAQVIETQAASKIQAGARGRQERQLLKSQLTLQEMGTKVLKKYVLKSDRFPDCHKLDTLDGDIGKRLIMQLFFLVVEVIH